MDATKTARPTLFQRLGGAPAVNAAVSRFYVKVLSDPTISGFFAATDMERQAAKQRLFLTVAFGGAPKYSGLSMREAHAALVKNGLDDSHFDAVVGHLAATLRELNVGEADIAEVAAIAESTRKDVLNR